MPPLGAPMLVQAPKRSPQHVVIAPARTRAGRRRCRCAVHSARAGLLRGAARPPQARSAHSAPLLVVRRPQGRVGQAAPDSILHSSRQDGRESALCFVKKRVCKGTRAGTLATRCRQVAWCSSGAAPVQQRRQDKASNPRRAAASTFRLSKITGCFISRTLSLRTCNPGHGSAAGASRAAEVPAAAPAGCPGARVLGRARLVRLHSR